MTYEEALKYYQENFPWEMPYKEISDKINAVKNEEDAIELRKIFCDNLLFAITRGYLKYDEENFGKGNLIETFKQHVEKMPEDSCFFRAVYHYFNRDNRKSLQFLKLSMEKIFEDKNAETNEFTIIECFQEPFKQGFDGFWEEICTEIRKYESEKSILEYCDLLKNFYNAKTNDEKVDELGRFIQKYPEFVSPREMLASTYQDMGMWKNTIACIENVEQAVLFYDSDLNFMAAWAYGKCKELRKEEEYYRKCLEIHPGAINATNNLAYCLYKQKRYLEAKELLEECIEEKKDLPYSANNYTKVLIALGRNADAKKFIRNKEFKISKNLRDKVLQLDNTNTRLKKVDIVDDLEEEFTSSKGEKIDSAVKGQQFSSEKLLEDELTARIESGMPVFGMNLKIYRRHGSYGRQFIIPVGRLDLLCEDMEGNLYIIELKKDSGYDDAYKQTAEYLDWFENNEISKDKKVYGIICLNNPTSELIAKVHKDHRMKLFEYQISYREV